MRFFIHFYFFNDSMAGLAMLMATILMWWRSLILKSVHLIDCSKWFLVIAQVKLEKKGKPSIFIGPFNSSSYPLTRFLLLSVSHCSTKACSCSKQNIACSAFCGCSEDSCSNQLNSTSDAHMGQSAQGSTVASTTDPKIKFCNVNVFLHKYLD